jgi:aspartate carbamoyltransferase catalytic subunit
VGDLARGRTVRSLAWLLTNYRDVEQCFVAPSALQIGKDILDLLRTAGVRCTVTPDFDAEIPSADAIYMTRIQDEWDAKAGESSGMDISQYSFGPAQLRRLKADAVVMHPFPRRAEVSPEVDRDPRAVFWRQMRNGMWIRTALIAAIFGRDRQVRDYYETNV